jgi:predicted DNA-binding protein (MmcQ/YjbR family)
MNVEDLRNYCLAKSGTSESMPFGDETLVIKVGSKMFILISLDENLSINLKAEPEEAIYLREHFNCVLPGYHMNKKHWNTVIIDGYVNDDTLKQWIDKSYSLVLEKLNRIERNRIINT